MRIRTIKPEFWQSERLATLPRDARLLFIGLWGMADDHGRFRAHPSLIRAELFPYDVDTDVPAWLGALEQLGLVQLYLSGGQHYGLVVGFREHQKIDRRWASRLPPPPELGEPHPKTGEAHQSIGETHQTIGGPRLLHASGSGNREHPEARMSVCLTEVVVRTGEREGEGSSAPVPEAQQQVAKTRVARVAERLGGAR